jgi:ribonuclease BN (tRNA processing enzyme)
MLNYLDVLFDGSYSPFSGIHKMPSNIEFVQLKDKRHAIGVNLDVSFCSLNHIHSKKISDDTEVYGYKFQTKSRSIVILTDHEGVEGEVNDSVVAFSKDCDLLVHDAQFTDAEYEHKKGWGHSCFGQALKNATRINARHTLLTHHDPKRDDEEIEDHTRVLSEDYKGISFGFAKEGIIY